MSEPTTKRPLRVFLCHASADKPAVRELYDYLKQHGIHPWLDEIDLLPGQHWREQIPEALNSSDVIIVCLSKNSVDKEGYIQKEIRYALDKAEEMPEGTIFIIPARLEECNVPTRLKPFQWVDLFSDNGHKQLMQSLNVRAAKLGPNIAQGLVTVAAQPKVSRSSKIVISIIGCSCLLITMAALATMLSPLHLPDIFATPTWTLIPTSTVTLTPASTPTGTPSSPAEAAILTYLSAIKDGSTQLAAAMVSEYSLSFYTVTREDVESDIRSALEQGEEILDYEVIGAQVLTENVSVRFRVIWTRADGTAEKKEEAFFTAHQDMDGMWRINVSDLVDYRAVNSKGVSDPSGKITLRPAIVQRHQQHLTVYMEVITPTGDLSYPTSGVPFCVFPDGVYGGKFVRGKTKLGIQIDGFYKDYPLSCSLPELGYVQFSYIWKSPEIPLEYK
jgi:hypothetical protein